MKWSSAERRGCTMEKLYVPDRPVAPEGDSCVENLKRIRETMAQACLQAGRREEDVTLLAVTKTVEAARINRAILSGVRHIGENRVQEFLGKRESLLLDDMDIHLIGHLQTNKVEKIVDKVDMIESIDSLRLAQAVDAAAQRCGKRLDVLVEVNIGGEESKSGVAPDRLEELLHECAALSSIHVCGLMTIPPISDKEKEKREFFSRMHKLFIDIRDKNIDNITMSILSMGMSSDYAEAILEGATMVRIGSALFGARH